MTGDFGQIHRRRLVPIATSKFAHYADLDEVPDEVSRITAWLTNEEKLGDRHFTLDDPQIPENPSLKEIEDRFKHTPEMEWWNTGDAAVLYITGHGRVLQHAGHPQHHLILTNTNVHTNYEMTALPTAELLRWLARTRIEYLLVIIDVCSAGHVLDEIMDKAKDHWLVLPSALEDQEAEVGALTKAIGMYLEKAAEFNRRSPYLTVGLFVFALNQMLDAIAPGQRIEGLYKGKRLGKGREHGDAHDPHVCLPNPAYQPEDGLVETTPALQSLALRAELLTVHNRIAGRLPSAVSPGWLFTGRETLTRDLVRAAGEPGITMITGSAGCGKSTALSRLVTLSDPTFRGRQRRELKGVPADLLPSRGAVDVALSARRRSIRQVLTQICYDLGALGEITSLDDPLEPNLRALSAYVRSKRKPVTIVIDGLDEAQDAVGLVTSVLRPLSEEHPERLRVLVGLRSPGGDGAVSEAVEPGEESLLDLMTALGARRIAADNEERWDHGDLVTFIGNILTNTPESPYRNADRATVTAIAEAIGGAARRSYLMAWTAANTLAGKGKTVISPDDPAWLAGLKEGLLGSFRDDLRSSLPTDALLRRGVTLLRAAAFARGNGVPRHLVWPAMAHAIATVDGAGGAYGDGDIRDLLGSRLNAYLEVQEEDDLTVYRLMHNELRDILRWRWRELLAKDGASAPPADEDEIREVEAAIAWQLRGEVGRRATLDVAKPVPPYIRRHLAEHALAGDELDECVPVHFLPYLDLAALHAAVGSSPARLQFDQKVPWLPVLRQVTHQWDWYRPPRNATAIEMWAMLNEAELLGSGREPGPVGGPWQVRWAIRPPDLGNILGRHQDGVVAVATAELADGPVALTGGQDGLLRTWDLSTGAPYRDREPIVVKEEAGLVQDGEDDAVRCIATTRLASGRTVAVTGSADGFIRVWDLASGRVLGDPLGGGTAKIEAVTTAILPDGRAVVSAADDAGDIRSWDLDSRERVGRPVSCGANMAQGLTTALVEGQVIGLATGEDSGLRLWDVATGDPIGNRLADHPLAGQSGTGSVQGGRVVAAVALDGRDIAITGNGDGLLLWDIGQQEPIRERLCGGDGVIRALAVGRVGDLVLAVTGGNKAVQVWDLAAREPLGEMLTGHGGSVEAVAIASISEDAAFAVSVGRDASVRLWDVPRAALSPRRPSRQIGIVESVATVSPSRGGPLAVTCSHTLAQVWDLERGGDPVELTGYDSPVVSVATADFAGGVLVVGGHWDGQVSTWRAADGTLLRRGGIGDIGSAASLATTVLDGRLLAVVGDWDGSVYVWDPLTATRVGEPLCGHTDVVVAVATATTDDQRTVVVSGGRDGQVRIRDLGAHVDPGDPAPREPVVASIGTEVASLTVTTLADGLSCVVVGGENGRVYLLGLLDGAPLADSWPAAEAAVAAVTVGRLPDGRVALFTGGEEPLVQAWDVITGRPITGALPVPGPVLALAFDDGTSSLVVGGTGVAVARPRLGG